MMDRDSRPRTLPRAAKMFSVRTSLSLSLGALATSLAACAGEPAPARPSPSPSISMDADAVARVGADAPGSACGSAPAASPSHEIDAPIVGPAYKHQSAPQVACEGDQCLVVWADTRTARSQIYATRVSTTGGVLDPFGIPIGEGYSPRVAAGGGRFLVSFGKSNGQSGGGAEYQVRAARVAGDGSVLDPGGFEINPLGPYDNSSQAYVTHAGGEFVVVWPNYDYNMTTSSWEGGIHGVRVAPDGSVIDPDGVAPAGALLVPQAVPRALGPSSAGAYLLWSPYDEYAQAAPIHGTRLGLDLAVLDPGGLLVAAPASEQYFSDPALGFDGSQNIVAWSTYYEEQALVRWILPDGTPREASPQPLTSMKLNGISGIAFAGSTAILMGVHQLGGGDWADPPEVALARLDGSGAQLDPQGQILSAPGYGVAVAAVGGKALAAWSYLDCTDPDCWNGRSTLQVGWIDPQTGQLEAPPMAVTLSSNEQEQPVVVPLKSGALVVWSDGRLGPAGEQGGIYATRVDAAGEALDPGGIFVGEGVASVPRAVFDGENTLVVWRRDSDTYPGAAWVDPSGAVIDAAPVDLWMLSDAPLLAPHPQGGALLLADYGYGGYVDVFRADPSGALIGPDPVVGLGLDDDEGIRAISFDGSNYLLVLHDEPWSTRTSHLRGALMSPTGEILAPGVFPIAVDRPRVVTLDVAFVQGKHVLLWQELGMGGDLQVRAAQIDADGQVLSPDGVEVATYGAGGCAHCGTLAFNASAAVGRGKHGALLAWKVPGGAAGTQDTQEVHGAELSASGAVGPRVTLAAEAGILGQIDLGRLGGAGGKALLTYGRFQEEVPYRARRMQARVVRGSCGGGNP